MRNTFQNQQSEYSKRHKNFYTNNDSEWKCQTQVHSTRATGSCTIYQSQAIRQKSMQTYGQTDHLEAERGHRRLGLIYNALPSNLPFLHSLRFRFTRLPE